MFTDISFRYPLAGAALFIFIVIILLAPQAKAGSPLWMPANDPGTGTRQGLPFIIEGRAGGGSLECNGPLLTFEMGLPTDWTNRNDIGSVYWTSTEDPRGCIQSYEVGSDEPAICADADKTNPTAEPYEASLYTNSIAVGGVTSAILDLRFRHRWLNASVFDIAISTDLGQSYTVFYSDTDGGPLGGEAASISLDSFLGDPRPPSMILRFRFHGNGWDWYTQVDDVELHCWYPPPNPDIDVDPWFIGSTQEQDSTTSHPLDISNIGTADLNWEIVEAAGANCTVLADIPWVQASPNSGTTAPGATSTANVKFDAKLLSPGTYAGILCVRSNDPDAGPGNRTKLVEVDLEMVVEKKTSYEIYLPQIIS